MNLLSLLSVLREVDPKPVAKAQSAGISAVDLPPTHGLNFWQDPPMENLLADVKSIVTDSRELAPGMVFVAVKGSQRDGHEFVPMAMATPGVVAVIADVATVREMESRGQIKRDLGQASVAALMAPAVPLLLVRDTRVALDLLARRIFLDPSHRLLCFGVTGTNGKTSTVYLLEHLLNRAGLPCGVLGTINHHLNDEIWPSTHTTPDPVRLQGRLAEMKSLGAQAIAMEVSSHALDQRRADGVQFNTVIFTNLTRDHLDYHHTEEAYFAAKQRLFSDLLWESRKIPLFAVVNSDDPWGRRLRVCSNAGLWTFGKGASADFRFEVLGQDFSGMTFRLTTPVGEYQGELPLIGEHNLYNAMGALAAVATVGVMPEKSLNFLKDFAGVPGRLQRVADARGRFIFVDYAHTPDALENVLRTLNEIRDRGSRVEVSSGSPVAGRPRILTLFGCGGDRDKGKRPQMAAVAEKYSDWILVTSDNPRSEEPEEIIDQVVAGFSQQPTSSSKDVGAAGAIGGGATLLKWAREADRATAIRQILTFATGGDVVLIAGKGHEDYQEIKGERRSFSDVKVTEDILRERG